MTHLIPGIDILVKYKNPFYPSKLNEYVHVNIKPSDISDEDTTALEALGFVMDSENQTVKIIIDNFNQ